jgi:hypothetical protein
VTTEHTIAEFVETRLDEDTHAATEATPGTWRYNPQKHYHIPGTVHFYESVFAGPPGAEALSIAQTGQSDDRQSMRDAAFIAHNDPTRALREAQVKQELIALHAAITGCCAVCVESPWGYPTPDEVSPLAWPCRTVRLLASSWRDHPDYRPEWRP